MQITKLGSVRSKKWTGTHAQPIIKETALVLGKEHGTILKMWAIMATHAL